MPGLNRGDEPYHVTLTSADDVEIGLIAVGTDGKPIEFEGSLTPVDATEEFRPGGIPREFRDFSAGAGYSFYDERVPNAYSWGKNVWTLVPHAALPSGEVTEIDLPTVSGTHGAIRTGIQVNGHLYFSTGRYACKITNATGAATVVADFATIAAMATGVVVTAATLYLGNVYWGGYHNGTAQPLVQHIVASDTFTSGATCARIQVASFFGVDGEGTYDQWLVGTVATNAGFKYTNSASPLVDTNWTPAGADGIQIGEPNYGVSKILTSRQQPFFMKPEGIFIVQRLGVYIPNITPHWRSQWYVNNGVAGDIIGGRLYASVLGGIDMVRGLDGELNDTPYYVHPGADLPTENPAAGDCFAITHDGDWVVAGIYNHATNTSYICWGKPREAIPGQPGLTNYIWHVAPCVIEDEQVTYLEKVSSGGAAGGIPYLMIGTVNSSGTSPKLYRMSLPRNGNVLQELAAGGPWRCRTDTCTLYLSRYPGSQGAHSEKAMRQVAVVSKDTTESSYLAAYIDPDEAGRTQLGPNVTEKYVEARILSDISGRQMAPSIDFTAGSNTTPPILRAVTFWAGEGIKATTTYRGRFRFAYGTVNRKGGKDTTTDQQAIWELLIGAQGPRPANLIDWKGTAYTIAFEQGAAWKEREQDGGNRYEIDAVMQFTVIGQTATYNSGYVYDSAATYAEDA